MLNGFRFAWLTVVRQPARTLLGILGVAAVGALLFDMLLLSRGLVLSFGDLLGRAGFDIRVIATDAPLFTGPEIRDAARLTARISALPEVEAVSRLRVRRAELPSPPGGPGVSKTSAAESLEFLGADPGARPLWTILEGRDLPRSPGAEPALVVNRNLSRAAHVGPGSTLALRGRCGADALPAIVFRVVGIADFPFDDARALSSAGTLRDVETLCGMTDLDTVDLLLVRSRSTAGADMAAAAIRRAAPGLQVVTNEDIVERFSRVEFSYFRQISVVLATVTLFFGFLLIAVLLTVSVNQRLAEIAALRAIGLSRARVISGVLWESALLVGTGGLLAIPLGFALSVWLDRILRTMPGVPADLHFFVYEPRALVLHVSLLGVASIVAALYPMRLVAALPIAATLRREVVS